VSSSVAGAHLLERADELSALDGQLGLVASTGSGRVVLVGGEAGVGKTALLRRFCDEHDVRVLWGNCDPLFTPRPLGPLFAVAEQAGPDVEQVVARGLLPHEVVGSLAEELRFPSPSVFVLEDLHWADEATLDVVRLLWRRIESLRALIVVTFRDDELDRATLLRILLGEIGAGDRTLRLKLQPLSPAAVAELAEPHDVDAAELYRRTGGNAFFVVEALAAGGEDVPPTVRDAVFARAARLSPEARRLLEAVAVVSSHAAHRLLEALVGPDVEAIDECIAGGILEADAAGVGFRHELARLAIEETIAPSRKRELHRRALAALTAPAAGAPDLARLAHHAELAGDVEAVLRFAPAAAASAASMGAYREAAAQYERALRFGADLPSRQRAEWLELRAHACYLTDQYDVGIEALEAAAALRRADGDALKEGDDLRRLSQLLWCPGRVEQSERVGAAAVELLEGLEPSRELAAAYSNRAFLSAVGLRRDGIAWAQKAIAVAEARGDEETLVGAHARLTDFQGPAERAAVQRRAGVAGFSHIYAELFIGRVALAVENHRHKEAARLLARGIAYCSERGFELFRLYLLALQADLLLEQGRWDDAADIAASVLRVPRSSTTPRINSLVVLGLVRTRRGDPGSAEAFQEAHELAEPTGELLRLGRVAAARAEAAWLRGDHDAVIDATERALALALELESWRHLGCLGVWRRRVGDQIELPGAAEPYALELAGDPGAAAVRWRDLGCPYDAALAFAQTSGADGLQQAHDAFQRLGAKPAAAFVARRLRERGARVARGPRPSTRENPAGLTARELEVLALVAEGLRNADIAQRLFLAEKTVDHHVSAILRKLAVRTRGEAGAAAARLGLVSTPT
jgi:DNA-binding CsgD family transcriptional regulator/tetratricopeptide (TPR) repeat protein